MSAQLILFPQGYKGYSSNFSGGPPLQFLVDGINFTGLNVATSFTTGNITYDNILVVQSPSIVNTWYRSREFPTQSYPTEISSNAVLYAIAGATQSSTFIYQRLDNLTVGQVYTVTVNVIVPGASGSKLNILCVKGNNYSTLITNQLSSANVSILTASFAAQTTQDIVMIGFHNNPTTSLDDTLTIGSITVTQNVLSPPSGVYTNLQDGQVICDLYQEEDIPLTLSIDDFKNVAEQVKSYSKDFNLPATKRNNQIFNNMFEITRASDRTLIFNPYVKTKCVLKQDGFILFEGSLRMINIKDDKGEISYNVNLYSEVVAFAAILKDLTFSNLDFTELEHEYNRTQIQSSWYPTGPGITYTNPSTSGFRDANDTVKYPFINWTNQYSLNATTGYPKLPNLESTFRPCIQLKYLIERIFTNTPFSFTSDFFDTTDFKKLYMDFNWGADNNPTEMLSTTFETYYFYNIPGGSGSGANYATNSFSTMKLSYNLPIFGTAASTPPNYDDVSNIVTSTISNETYTVNYSYTIGNADTVAREIECRWLYNNTPINNTPAIGSASVITIGAGGHYTYLGNFTQIMTTPGDTLKVEFRTDSGTGVMVRQTQVLFPTSGALVVWVVGAEAITSQTILQTLRGELGQWDFLKGIMTMFNLITMVDEDNPNNILIEPYAEVFIKNTNSGVNSPAGMSLAHRSIQHDWTDKVDVSQMELKPLTDLNKETIFQFVEDEDDYAFQVFKNAQSGWLYGSEKINAVTSSSGLPTILEGTKEIIAEPFAATVVKPLMSQFSELIVPAVYARGDNHTWEGFDNSPRIFYNNGKKDLTNFTYKIPTQNGVPGASTQDKFLQFSHLSDVPTIVSSPPSSADTIDFVFRSSQLPSALGDPPVDNLYSMYWQPYFNELYNADTRTMTLKVNLSPSDIASFKFFDTVMIKNRSFRVNKIEYKPNSLAKVEFILIP